MDLTGWTCTNYVLYKGYYQIFIFPYSYKIYQYKTDNNNFIAEIIGLSDAIAHVENLLNKEDNV